MLPMIQPETSLSGVQTVDGSATPSPSLPPSHTPDSEIDDVVVSFFDIDVAIQRIEPCDLQLGDTWRGMQGKMSVTAPVKKIRKKSDHKPQSQVNKCHNEKRRRELENETINQLEELLGTCLAEVKQPDKNGIVREATRQIQEVLKRRRECPSECPQRLSSPRPPLQAGEVSSTQPPNSPLQYSELTTLIEALKHYTSNLGWILLEINAKGEIECVTENIKELIFLDRKDLHKKSIFSLLHANDHPKIRPLLRNIQSFGWGAGDIDKLQAVQAKLLFKNDIGSDSASYVEALIHAAAVRGSPEAAGSVMCVIRRCKDASALSPLGVPAPAPVPVLAPALTPAPAHRTPRTTLADHLVFRLDTSYTILSCDLSGVENSINSPLSLVGTQYLDLVESSDREIAISHLAEAACHPAPPAVSAPFRLCVCVDRPWVRVSARSRLFAAKPSTGEPDFIMSTHSVLGEDEPPVPLASPSPAPAPALGGPLMTSVANGEGAGDRYRDPDSPHDSHFAYNDFDLDQWTTPFHLAELSGEESRDRKDGSEGRLTPLTPRTPHTPHTPHTPGEPPPPPPEEPNRLRSLLSKKPSEGANNRILKDLLQQEDEEASSSEHSAPHTPKQPGAAPPVAPPASRPAAPSPAPAHTPAMHHQHDNNSHMLLRILNEKSDEDGEDRIRDGRPSQPSALLTQLLSSNGPASNGRAQEPSDNYLERIAGVKRKMEEAKMASAKRATPEAQQVSSSAAPVASSSTTTPATSGSGMSSLCQKNQILVSLLAKQQQTPIARSIQRGFEPRPRPHLITHPHPPQPQPQHHQQTRHHTTLSNMLTGHPRLSTVNGGAQQPVECTTANMQLPPAQSHLQLVLQGGGRAPYQPVPPVSAAQTSQMHYASAAPHHVYNNQPQSNTRSQSSSDLPSDQALSDILDDVVDSLPDSDRSTSDFSVLIAMEGNRQMRPDYNAGKKEENAMINAIRQSLMQCEKVSKSPVSPSPGAPPVYPVQSPGSCNIGGNLYTLTSSPVGAGGGAVGPAGAGGAARGEADANRARALVERARLLQMQRSQQMLVSPEAADNPQADLGSQMSALVSATPPNVSLTRTDYHHHYHNSNYGTNKITSPQQNPMLSRQLSTGGSVGAVGYAQMSPVGAGGGAAALHTPLAHSPLGHSPAPQPPLSPYHRAAQRPALVGGYYEDGAGGYCGEYARRPPPPHAHAHAHAPLAALHDATLGCTGNGSGVSGSVVGVGGGGGTSEYVRNELRAVVGARSSRPDLHQQMQPELDPLLNFEMPTPGGEVAPPVAGAGAGVGAGASAGAWPPLPANSTEAVSEAAAGPGAEVSVGAEVSAGAAAGAGGGDAAPAAAGAAGTAAKASLLQKLLSQ